MQNFNTVNHLIFAASKFGDIKGLTYWCSFILAVSQFNVPDYLQGAYTFL